MNEAAPQTSPLPALYVEGERLGWVFQDRNLYRRRFVEPAPVMGVVPADLFKRVNDAKVKMPPRMIKAGAVALVFTLLFGCCAGVGNGSGAFGVLAFLSLLGGAGAIGGIAFMYTNAKNALQQAQESVQQQYRTALAGWEARKRHFEHAEQVRVDQLYEWGAATPAPGTRRVDIIGGSVWGWEALLTVFGGSLLRTRGAVTLVDFSGSAVCRELVRLAAETGNSVDVKSIPADLPELDLLAGLDTADIVNALVESMYGDTPTASRADRHMDIRLMSTLCDALRGDVTIARLGAGLRVLMGESTDLDVLSVEERTRIADELFADEFKRQSHNELRRLEAYLQPLRAIGTAVRLNDPARLTCLVEESGGRSASNELLKDLTVQWLTRRVSDRSVSLGSLVIAGADDLSHVHIERLSDLCERRDIRLVLLFRHLRDESVKSIGGGAVGFMRLANHEEARQASEFIGRNHKFVLSQLTRTLGGNETHTIADTEGVSETEGTSVGSTSGGPHFTRHRSENWSVTRNWSQTVSVADGTNWSDAASAQRVYEYAVEPRVLQDLPDYALLLVKGQGNGSVLQPVECDPGIVTLPRVTMGPLPPMDLPDQSVAAIPVSGPPTHMVLSQPAPLGTPAPPPSSYATSTLPGWGTGYPPAQQPQYPPQPYPPQQYPPQQPQYPPQPYPPQQPPYPPQGWDPRQ